jgi:O-antigen/teichoic acid export membrane protein
LFGAAERILRAGLSFIGQATLAIFPRMVALKKTNCLSKLIHFRRLNLLVFLVIGLLGSVIIKALSQVIVIFLYGESKPEVISVLNIMAWVVPAIALSNVQAYQYLLVDGREAALNKVLLYISVINLIAAYFSIRAYGWEGLAYSWVAIEWCIVFVLGLVIKIKFESKEDLQ